MKCRDKPIALPSIETVKFSNQNSMRSISTFLMVYTKKCVEFENALVF